MKPEKRTTDDNCMGWCLCPVCGGSAHWSFRFAEHACADPDCAHRFREHDNTQFDEPREPEDK